MSRYNSMGDDWRTLGADGGNQPTEYAADANEQLYVQVTFPYYNAYLGVVMVYNAATARQDVHCELAWSPDTVRWYRIEQGHDLIPLGPDGGFESHICYGSIPVEDPGWVTAVEGRTVPIEVTGSRLVLTADADTSTGNGEAPTDPPIRRGKVTVVAVPAGGGGAVCDTAVTGRNVTDLAVQPAGGGACDFAHLIGVQVVLHITVEGGAMLHMLAAPSLVAKGLAAEYRLEGLHPARSTWGRPFLRLLSPYTGLPPESHSLWLAGAAQLPDATLALSG
eukprot:gene43580-65104_t